MDDSSCQSSRPLRILHVISTLGRGGIETWLLTMLKTISRESLQMDVCCKGGQIGELADVARGYGAQVHHTPMGYRPLAFANRLATTIKQNNYDVVHCHLNSHNGVGVLGAKKVGVPTVASFHSERLVGLSPQTARFGVKQLSELYCHWSVRYVARKSEIIAPVSKAVLQALMRYAEMPSGRTEVLYLGATEPEPIDKPRVDQIRKSLVGNSSSPIVLHVGSFRPAKNHSDLLAIFAKVKEAEPDAKLLLVGDGPLRETIETEVRDRQLADVQFLGLRDDVSELMAVADVFLLPSLYEGLPIVVMEAAAAKIPIVASNIPSISEAIADGENGFLAEIGQIDQYAYKVLKLITDDAEAERVSQAARRQYEQRFSLAASATRLSDAYARAHQLASSVAPVSHSS